MYRVYFKILPGIVLLFGLISSVSAQETLFSAQAMREDLRFIRKQLFRVHASPFTRFTRQRYEAYLDSLETGLNQPLSAAGFLQKAAPALIPLDDEHAALSLRNRATVHKVTNWSDSITTNITYRRMGKVGYIRARSFATKGRQDLPVYKRCIDSIFALIHHDGVTRLAIDISDNDGGASAVGNMIINHIYQKPYQSYSMNWKRSDEYLAKLTSWGLSDASYQKATPGEVLQNSSSQVQPEKVANPFTGKVIVLIGPKTFSSAILFATLIQDNKIAPLAGESPVNGHPTHFGEMYSVVLPHTQLQLRFGVKEWIRPAGRSKENKLVADIPYKLPANGEISSLIQQLGW